MLNAILLALAPIFFVLALGYVAGRLRIVDNRNVDGFNALVMDFALPASLFVATASAPRSEMVAQAPLFAILGVVMLLVYFGWYFLVQVSWPVSKADASLQALTVAFPNMAGVGLPIASAVLGPDGTVPVAVVLAAGSILVSPLTLIVVEMSTNKGEASEKPTARVARAIRRALTKPIVIAPALGILVSLSGLQLGSVIEACLMLIGHAAPGVALFLTGLILSAQPFRLDWKVVSATWLTDIVRPMLTAAVVFVLPVSTDVAKVAILLAAVPSGFFGILFAVNYRLDSATAGSMVAASTVFSIVTLAITIAMLYPNEALPMTLAILCSGQGRQHPDMFALTGDAPEAANLFSHAAKLLGGRDPREIVQTDTDSALHQNRVGQILCTVQALVAAATLCDAWPRRFIIAGYSVGEVAAWGVAGLVDATVALDLVARRAEAMDAASAVDEGLLFIRGLSRDTVDGLCKRHSAAVAIVNPGDAYILGGAGEALDALAEDAKVIGAARVVRLAVNVASHTARLAAASMEFRKVLDQTPIRRTTSMGVRLLSGIDGGSVFDIQAGLDKLAAQISHTVQWAACLEGCVEAGASGFLELGPGSALAEMAGSAYPHIPARSIEDFRSVDGVRSWLAGFG